MPTRVPIYDLPNFFNSTYQKLHPPSRYGIFTYNVWLIFIGFHVGKHIKSSHGSTGPSHWGSCVRAHLDSISDHRIPPFETSGFGDGSDATGPIKMGCFLGNLKGRKHIFERNYPRSQNVLSSLFSIWNTWTKISIVLWILAFTWNWEYFFSGLKSPKRKGFSQPENGIPKEDLNGTSPEIHLLFPWGRFNKKTTSKCIAKPRSWWFKPFFPRRINKFI